MCVYPTMLRNSITGGDSYIGEVKRERGIAAEADGVPRSRSLREGKDVRISADEQGDSPFDDVEAELSSGEGGEVATSDGEVRHFSPGGILLVEDTRGKGYSSRVGGETYGMAAIVQLAS